MDTPTESPAASRRGLLRRDLSEWRSMQAGTLPAARTAMLDRDLLFTQISRRTEKLFSSHSGRWDVAFLLWFAGGDPRPRREGLLPRRAHPVQRTESSIRCPTTSARPAWQMVCCRASDHERQRKKRGLRPVWMHMRARLRFCWLRVRPAIVSAAEISTPE